MEKIKELSDYIEKMKAQGLNNEEIKNNLKTVGWDERIIEFHLQVENPSFQQAPVPEAPKITEEELQSLDKNAWILIFFSKITRHSVFLLFAYILVRADVRDYLAIVAIVLVVFLIITLVIARLEYHFYYYKLGSEGFYKERGIIAKKYVTIPYEKIQNIDIMQSVVARLLNLYSINIQTAGNSGVSNAEGILPGVSKEEAERLKAELLKRSRMFR